MNPALLHKSLSMDQLTENHRLSELKTSESGTITKVLGHGSFRKRITEMGFVRGKTVRVVKNAPFLDPVEYEIMGYRVALRRSEAALVEVSTGDLTDAPEEKPVSHALQQSESANRFLHPEGKVINVALVGNPNCGKTSFFNIASGSREKVGNYGGVTVETKTATVRRGGYTFRLSDLPGTYSITEYTPEELYVRRHILEQMPDVVINMVDASNLERNLFLTTQLIDMDLKVVLALNMYDELQQSGAEFDYEALGQMLGIPIVPTIASKGFGTDQLLDTVTAVFEDNEPMVRHIHINYGPDVEQSIRQLQNLIWENSDIVARYSSRYLAVKLLEGDKQVLAMLQHVPNYIAIAQTVERETARLEKLYADKVETVIANARYGFIAGALEETFTPGKNKTTRKKTDRIDRALTHKYWGFPIFLLFMWLMFQTTFSLGEYPMTWIEEGVSWLGEKLSEVMAEGTLRDLLVDGIVGGVGGVLVFLPNILILFFFISLMEDTGYMARAAFIMDRSMHKIGLHGKSFIPLLMGFGCNVPAIMATRTLESRKDRVLTMLIMPFISCSARLPVYILLISAFFPRNQGLVMLSIYLVGVLIAVLSSIGLKRVFFRKEEAPFVMELPPYRIPTAHSVVKHMWSKGVQYLKKMGTVILFASILIWALGHYPQAPENSGWTEQEQQENSYIGRLGHAVEPVIRPLGFDWKIGVSLVTGLAAKEVVVSTMAVLYASEGEIDDPQESALETEAGDVDWKLVRSLQKQQYTSGPKAGQFVYTPLVAYTMMIFILLYFPCIAVIAAIRKEAGRKWAVFTVFYSTGMAWLISLIVFQVGSFLGL